MFYYNKGAAWQRLLTTLHQMWCGTEEIVLHSFRACRNF